MLIPIRGRFRVSEGGYVWSDTRVRSHDATVTETRISNWRPLLSPTNMPTAIASISLDDVSAFERFLGQWGLPVIPDEAKPASMRLADVHKLVRQMREALSYATAGDDMPLAQHITKHAFIAARPKFEDSALQSSAPIFVEARDLASFAWLQLGQRQRGEYRRCGQCGTYFSVAGAEGHRRSRQYCSDRCRVAANRAKKR